MNIIFDDLATKEYHNTIEYYEIEIKGLGEKFNKEIKRALRNIRKYPTIGSLENSEIRRYILPFKILYSIEKDYIYIIAIAHMHREPNYWINRSTT